VVDTSIYDTGIYRSKATYKVFKFSRNLIERKCLPNSLRDILSYFELYIKSGMFKSEVRRELLFYPNHWLEIEHTEDLASLFFIGGLLECVLATQTIEGDIIELGTYKGGTSIMIARFLKSIGSKKRIYTCDTFEGHPYDDKFGKDRKGRFSDVNISYVEDKFFRFGVADKIRIIKGIFEDVLYKKLGEKKFSFAFLDCDLYQSTKYALNFLIPRMANGAIIALHDYGNPHFGLTKAVHEQCQKSHLKVNLYPIPHIHMKQPLRK